MRGARLELAFTDGSMDPAEPSIAFDQVAPLVEALRALGHEPPTALPRCADGAVAARDVAALWDGAARALHDEHVALSLLAHLPAGTLGLLDHALVTGATLRTGLEVVTRYLHVVDRSVILDLVIDGPTATLVLTRAVAAPACRHADELILAWLVARMRHVLVRHAVVAAVGFAHPRSPAARVVERYFSAEVGFDAPRHFLRVPVELLDAPSRTAAPGLAAVVTAELARLAGDDPLLLRVGALLRAREVPPGLDEVAQALGTSPRSLQRELRGRGLSFRAVVERVRCETALFLLRTAGAPPAHLARAAGYEDETSFARAFRRWTGRRPRDA